MNTHDRAGLGQLRAWAHTGRKAVFALFGFGMLPLLLLNIAAAPGDKPPDKKVNVNTATVEQMTEGLPGIGPGIAKAIVAARPFTSVEELDLVRGIGPATMAKIRPHVTLGDADPDGDDAKKDGPDGVKKDSKPVRTSDVARAAALNAARAREQEAARRAAVTRAIQARLEAYQLKELKTLLAASARDFQRWQEEEHISSTGHLKAGIGRTRLDEIRLVQQCQEWQLKITLLKKEIKDREKAFR